MFCSLGAPPEPAAKRSRVVIDESDIFAKALAMAAPVHLSAPGDVRSFLTQPLPEPVLIDESHAALLAAGAGCFRMQARPAGRAMPELEALLESAFNWHISSSTEEVWASLADVLTGHVWRTLSKLAGTFAYVDNRNSTDCSGATQRSLRPDYCGWSNHALVMKAEHKAELAALTAALAELASKMRGWNTLVMRGVPFLPCFAVGGHLIQFAVVHGGPNNTVRVETVTDPMPMSTGRDRLRVVAASFNMFRVMTWLRERMPDHVIPLYVEQPRADGGSVTVFDDHVIKRCMRVAPQGLYDALAPGGGIPCAVHVVEHTRPSAEHPLARLKLQPVALQALPRDEAELRRATAAVLHALAALHARGFVHRDVRWPNVLADGSGGWLLVDFELADVAGEPLPAGAVDADAVAPEARVPRAPYNPAADAWQVGRLMRTAGITQLSPAASALADALSAPLHARLGVSDALAHAWLQPDGC